MTSCPNCNQPLSEPTPPFCPHCGAAILGTPPGASPPATGPPFETPAAGPHGAPDHGQALSSGPPDASRAPAGVPWQRRDTLGVVPALVETARDALVSPTAFFRAMLRGRGIGEALAYGVVIGWLGQLINAFYQLILHSLVGSSFARGTELPEGLRVALSQFEGITAFVVTALFGWLLVGIGLFVWSGLVHLALMATGAARHGYETTLSVACYAESAVLWSIVPFCGGIIAFVHLLVLNTIGLAQSHGISTGQALLAVLLPLLLCCCCIPGLIAIVLGGLGAVIGSMAG